MRADASTVMRIWTLLLVAVITACGNSPGQGEQDTGIPDVTDYADTCYPGEVLYQCYSGLEGTEGVGACKAGIEICETPGCIYEVLPVGEICDGIDNDCDGSVDEALYSGEKCFACAPDGAEGIDIEYGRICNLNGDCQTVSPSTCQRGCSVCREGEDLCIGWVGPEEETCDGADNDCDTFIDETSNNLGPLVRPESCGFTDEGTCTYGDSYCRSGEWECRDDIGPWSEICDGLDNDCDRATDEDDGTLSGLLERGCVSDCEPGIEFCIGSDWVECTARLPQPEVCDGEDNDCNGLVDEDLNCDCSVNETSECPSPRCAPIACTNETAPEVCPTGLCDEGRCEDWPDCVPCGWGIQVCDETGQWGSCEGQVIRNSETCNLVDDNCNAEIDEGFYNTCYDGLIETLGVGECTEGWYDCIDGELSECMDETLPSSEVCDGLDNDCDGLVDDPESVNQVIDLCFAIDYSGSMNSCVEQLIEQLTSWALQLAGEDHRFCVVLFGGLGAEEPPHLVLDLTTVENLIVFLGGLESFIGADEPSIDAVREIGDPGELLSRSINWDPIATPVVVLIADENPQTDLNMTAADAMLFTQLLIQPCRLPGCDPATNEYWTDPDAPLELFIFGNSSYRVEWGIVTPDNGQRFFTIATGSSHGCNLEDHALNLSVIFDQICIGN